MPREGWADNGGSGSAMYQEILTYFQNSDPQSFTDEDMDKIVGKNSMISLLDRTYTENLMHACEYKPTDDIITLSVGDQWTRGLITKLPEIPIFDTSNSSLFQ